MTDSSRPTSLPTRTLSDLPDPRDDPNLIETFAGYRTALSTMTIDQLMTHSAELAALQQAQSASILTALISPGLSEYSRSLDNPVLRSPRTASRPGSAADRGAVASQTSSLPRPQSALDLLAGSRRLAPRIAAKLVAHEVKRASRQAENL